MRLFAFINAGLVLSPHSRYSFALASCVPARVITFYLIDADTTDSAHFALITVMRFNRRTPVLYSNILYAMCLFPPPKSSCEIEISRWCIPEQASFSKTTMEILGCECNFSASPRNFNAQKSC